MNSAAAESFWAFDAILFQDETVPLVVVMRGPERWLLSHSQPREYCVVLTTVYPPGHPNKIFEVCTPRRSQVRCTPVPTIRISTQHPLLLLSIILVNTLLSRLFP